MKPSLLPPNVTLFSLGLTQAAAPRSSASPQLASRLAPGLIEPVGWSTATDRSAEPGRPPPRSPGLRPPQLGSGSLPTLSRRRGTRPSSRCGARRPPRLRPTAPRPRIWGLYADWPPREPARPGIGPAARRRGGGTQAAAIPVTRLPASRIPVPAPASPLLD